MQTSHIELARWALQVSVFCAALGVCLVLLFYRQYGRRSRSEAGKQADSGTGQITCTVCQKELVFHRNELVALSGPELALAVRAAPDLVGVPLVEYVCPYCETAHCFRTDRHKLEWVGANLYQPQPRGAARCGECGAFIVRPSWPPGAFDGRLDQAPDLRPEYGLVCPHCRAVCCVRCCTANTRGRSADGSLLCPRCFRGPLTTVFRF